MSETISVSVRLPVELVAVLDAWVEAARGKGRRSDRTREVEVALRRRQLAELPRSDRERVVAKLVGSRPRPTAKRKADDETHHETGTPTRSGDENGGEYA